VSFFSGSKTVKKGLVCLSFNADGLAIAVNHNPELDHICQQVDFLPCAPDEVKQVLSKYVAKHKLKDMGCACVLTAAEYRLLAIDPPKDIDRNALGSSASWLAKDLIDMPLQDAAVDAFYMPARAGMAEKASAVVAKREHLEALRDIITKAGLHLICFDIAELAFRNALFKLEKNKQGVVLLSYEDKHAQLLIVQEGKVSLVRRLNTLLQNENGDMDLLKSQVVLEVQRSLDFYQTQQGVMTPELFYVTADLLGKAPWILDQLENQVQIHAKELLFEQKESDGSELSDHLKQNCLLVLGEAQREVLENEKDLQFVNLLNAIPKPKKAYLPAKLMVFSWLVLIVILVLVSVSDLWQNNALAAQYQIVKSRQEKALARVTEYAKKHPKEDATEKLTQQIKTLQTQLASHESSINYLKERNLSNSVGFSPFLLAFSNAITPDVWLTRFNIEEAGRVVDVDGKTLNHAELLHFVQRLNRQKAMEANKLQFKLVSFKRVVEKDKGKSGKEEAQEKQQEQGKPVYQFKLTSRLDMEES
jgi:MSHA biogenesis protein MshI